MPKTEIIHYNPSSDMVLQIFDKVIAAQDQLRREKLAQTLAGDTGHLVEGLRSILPDKNINILHIIASGQANHRNLRVIEPYIIIEMYDYHGKYESTPLTTALVCERLDAFGALIDSQLRKLKSLGYSTDKIKEKLKYTVNISDHKGQTPLHIAAKSSLSDQISILLSLGANPNVKDLEGNLPAHFAAKHSINGMKSMKLLVEAGNNPRFQNNDGKTVLDIARENSRLGSEECRSSIFLWRKTDTEQIFKSYEKAVPKSWYQRIINTGYKLGVGGV